jgi:hypothetical protein
MDHELLDYKALENYIFTPLEKRKMKIGDKDNRVLFCFDFDPNQQLSQGGTTINLPFENCVFKGGFKAQVVASKLAMESCVFEKKVDFKNLKANGKVRFKQCTFNESPNFNNAKFQDLADFWRCTFKKEVIFYKTDFHGTVVFSATTFEENVLFTYTLIDKLILFRGAVIKKGIDLSTAIISGSIGTFGLELGDFRAINGKLSDEAFETAVSKKGEIPIRNKRETFRILKQANIQQNNVIESIPYQVLEKQTLLHELLNSLLRTKTIGDTPWENFTEKWRSIWDLSVLGLNWVSNSFGRAPIQGVLFTLSAGAIFFYLNITQTEKYDMALQWDWNILRSEIPNYFKFLLPTHGIEYLDPEFYKKYKVTNWYYVWDILGRVFVGFGIYQTIQAFRKFR